MATAIVSTLHDGTEVQLQRAFAASKSRAAAEASLARGANPAFRGTYCLSVTADTSERAKAELATLTKTLVTAFPNAERNLSVSPNNNTTSAPNDMTRHISLAVRGVVVLTILGSQFVLVLGAYREGERRAGRFAALATPFLVMITAPTRTSRKATAFRSTR